MLEVLKQALDELHRVKAICLREAGIGLCNEVVLSQIDQAIAELESQEPVAWKWHQAPVKTSWGHDMVVADLAIDKDNTVSVYCERDQTTKVEAMLSTTPQRTWVGLTFAEICECENDYLHLFARAIEAKLKQKNGFAEEKNT